MIKHLVEKLLVMVLFLSLGVVSVGTAEASQWKLSHEVEISKTRKICIYIEKESGHTKSVEVSPLGMNKVHRLRQVEQSKNQYCRTYL